MRKIDGIKIAGTRCDSRVKLTQDQKGAVKLLYREGYSQRKIAEIFGVSRWSIQSILTPPVRHSKDVKHSSEYWRDAKRRYVNRKTELFKAGKIK